MPKMSKRRQIIGTQRKKPKPPRHSPTKAATLKIGVVARKAGIPVVTVRFYEQAGLIASFQNAETKMSTHRRFQPSVLVHLDFIKLCRASGFSIPEIRSLMKLYRGFKVPSKHKMAALKRSIELIREQKARLGQIEQVLLYRLQNTSGELNELIDVRRG